MEREEVELLPSGLITCLLNSKEVRIMKISPERLTIRLAQEVKEINELKVIFYVFDENRYKEITIEKDDTIETLVKKINEAAPITTVIKVNFFIFFFLFFALINFFTSFIIYLIPYNFYLLL